MGLPARRTATPLVLVAAAVLSFIVVLGVTIGVGELLSLAEHPDGSTGFDRSITSWMVAHRASLLTSLAHALSTVGSQVVLLPVVAVAAIRLFGRGPRRMAALLLVIWAGAIELYSLAKHFVDRPRPPMHLWLTSASSSSFPSGHATQSLATFTGLALVCAALLPKARGPGLVVALLMAAGVGWSRVYLGVHWATDVIAGWLAAAAWVAMLMWLAHTRYSKQASS